MAHSDDRLRAILDAMPLKFFLKDTNNRILLTNKAVADSLGVAVGDVENTHTERWYPDDAEKYYQDDLRVMQSRKQKLGIVESLHVNGDDKHWITTDKHPYRDKDGNVVGILVFIRDATEQAQIEAALRESEAQHRKTNEKLGRVLESVSDYLWSAELGPDGNVTYGYYSPVVEKITGRPPEFYEAGPDRWLSTIHPDDRPRVNDTVAQMMSGRVGDLTGEYRIQRPDESIRWVRDSVKARSVGGGRVRLDGVVTDITERKRAEQEQQRLEERVRHTQKLESLGVLAGGIAHDFNNILTGVLGNANLAELELPPESPVQRYLALIQEAGQRAAALCNQMLAYTGKRGFTVKATSLSTLVEEITRMLEVSISKKTVLKFDLQDDLPVIEADPSQIQQVAMNLIINASEAIGEQSGVIAVSTGAMDCDRSYLESTYLAEQLAEGVYVYIEVSDTGCGMDAETRERVFDPFFTTKFTGRGLGLAAVLGIIRGHQGAIKVYSEPRRGTTFRVLFPASGSPAKDGVEEQNLHADWRGRGGVLVVDDEETVRTLAKHSLQRFGFDVLTAEDGRQALEIYRKRADDIVVVLLDLTMPHLSGEQVFRELRRIRPDVRVILSSGYDEQDAADQFVGKELTDFIQKPYKAMELVGKVRAVLEEDSP